MRSNGGVLSAEQVVHQPISTVLSGPAAGALGAATIAARAGYRSVLTCDGGGTSTDVAVITDATAEPDHRGLGRPVPGQDPDDRHRHRRRRRRIGRLDLRRRARSRSARVPPAPHPGPACYGLGGTEPTVTDAHLVLGRIPPHLLGGEIPLDVEAADRRDRCRSRHASA